MPNSSSQVPLHPFSLAPLSVWLHLIRANGGVARKHRGRLATVLLASALTLPLRLVESLRYGRLVDNTTLTKPPLIILGYGRTGTTHLHNLLVQDHNHASVTTLQALCPSAYLTVRHWNWLRRAVARNMPATRPMDNVAVSLDAPQEEELALACSCHMSYIHSLTFPDLSSTFFGKYSLLRGVSSQELAQWEQAYMEVVRKATAAADGRRIVLKSPTNLGKIAHMLRLFPEAKFVNIMRNPYVVYPSLLRMRRTLAPVFQLAASDWSEIERTVRRDYAAVMRQYLRDRALIPTGNFTEVLFEDLVADPMSEMARIYSDLALPDWKQARQHMEAYLQTVSNYRQNRYRIDQSVIDVVDRDWGFVLDHWNYSPPG